MRLVRKVKAPKKRYIDPHLIKRVASMDANSLFVSMDSTLMGLGALVDAYRFHDAPHDEVAVGIDALHAIWDEVLRREPA